MQTVTDSADQVRLMKGDRCVTVEVVAHGFLERVGLRKSVNLTWTDFDEVPE